MSKVSVYYEPQDDFGPKEYYYLHRYLHRWLFYYEKYRLVNTKPLPELLAMDCRPLPEQNIYKEMDVTY